MRMVGVLLVLLAVAACGKKAPVTLPTTIREVVFQEIKVPTPVIVMPPPELLLPFTMPPPIFVAPSDPNASVALTPEQARAYRAMVEERQSRWEAFLAWWHSLKAAPEK